MISRRTFLKNSAGAIAAGALAGTAAGAGPFRRRGSRLRVALAAYSFRQYFAHQRNGRPSQKPANEQIVMTDFIDYCAEQGLDGAELTSYFFPQDIEPAAMVAIRRHAFLRGIDIAGTAVGNNFTFAPGAERDTQMAYVKGWIDRAAAMGAPHIRVFAGQPRGGMAMDVAMRNVVANLREAGDYAGQHGIFLGIENHDSVSDAKTLLGLVKAADHPWVGVNLDSGNFRTADNYAEFAACAPYAVNVQLKVEMRAPGSNEKVPANLRRLTDLLRAANYQGYVVLEYEAAEDPYVSVPPLLRTLRELCA